jgi:peptidoglycan hydrolase-like protein with peptidoglycan-binding domain
MNINFKFLALSVLALFVVPVFTFAQSMTSAQLQAEIASLTAELQNLEQQLAVAGGSGSVNVSANPSCYSFNANLSMGSTGSAVTSLQTALRKDGESVTISGSFDSGTASAVSKFQEKYASNILAPAGLSSGTGYVGKATRVELNSLFGCAGTGNAITLPVVATPVTTSPASSTMPPVECPSWGCNGYPYPIVPLPIPTSTPSTTTPFVCPPNAMCVHPSSTLFTIVAAAQSIAGLSPSSGPVNTQVTITGSGFTATGNTINFTSSSVSDIVPNLTSNGTTIIFTVPTQNTPACSFASPPCPYAFIPTAAGTYAVSVTNANGTSNSATFTVTP